MPATGVTQVRTPLCPSADHRPALSERQMATTADRPVRFGYYLPSVWFEGVQTPNLWGREYGSPRRLSDDRRSVSFAFALGGDRLVVGRVLGGHGARFGAVRRGDRRPIHSNPVSVRRIVPSSSHVATTWASPSR